MQNKKPNRKRHPQFWRERKKQESKFGTPTTQAEQIATPKHGT
jgi:hypothetical protein